MLHLGGLGPRFPVYGWLMRLYPRPYREQYGEQMLLTLADMLDESSSSVDQLRIWGRTALDLPISLTYQHLSFTRQILRYETPTFVRRSSCISAALFAPFIIIATINDMAAHWFYRTWLWSMDVLFMWIVALPVLGLLSSVIALLWWLRMKRFSWLQSLRDINHNWMMLLPILLGVTILCLVFFRGDVRFL
jgi:hypothetical protein